VAAEVAVSLRRILVLLVLAAGLVTYLIVYELPQAEREATKDKLLTVDKDAITGVTLVYPDREIELAKRDKGWRLVRPVDAPADDPAVRSMLGMVVDAEVQRTLDEVPQDLSGFGLDKPNVVVRLTAKDATLPPIAVGKNTTIGGKTYVRKGDEPKIYLTTTVIQTGLNKQAKDLRDKQLLVFQDGDVTRVAIARTGGETTTLVRSTEGEAWTVADGQPADSTEVRSYLASLRAARAVDFPDDAPQDLKQYGLDKPRLTVTVSGKEGIESQTLALGAERTEGSAKHVYAQRQGVPTVYALGDWSYRSLDKGTNQFRDKTVLKVDPTSVGRVELTRREGGSVVLVRQPEGGWRFESGAEGKTSEGPVTRLLEDVQELRGAEIVAEAGADLGPFGLATPDVRVALADTQGKEIGAVIAAKHGGKHYVARAGSGPVFEVRDYMFARLDKKPQDFVEPTTTTTAPAKVQAGEEPALDDGGEGEMDGLEDFEAPPEE
jgi:hypothetical protein